MSNIYLQELTFNDEKINMLKSRINDNLKKYISERIIWEYDLNDGGHDINHIEYVLNRAFELANDDIDINILYTCVMFHDIACHIDRENHEILSAKKAYRDDFLNRFFSINELKTIKEAIEDHRASLEYEPRNIYGKILSSADRKVEIKAYLIASMAFDINKHPELSKEQIMNGSYEFAVKKFGKNGYAINKSYVNDGKYQKYLDALQYLIDNKEIYIELASIAYDEIIDSKIFIKR